MGQGHLRAVDSTESDRSAERPPSAHADRHAKGAAAAQRVLPSLLHSSARTRGGNKKDTIPANLAKVHAQALYHSRRI